MTHLMFYSALIVSNKSDLLDINIIFYAILICTHTVNILIYGTLINKLLTLSDRNLLTLWINSADNKLMILYFS